MSVNGVVSKGTLFKRGDGTSSETFTTVTEINSVSLPGGSRPVIDMTDLSSTAVEKLMGLIDEGQITLNMNFTRDNYVAMRTDFLSDSSVNYQIVLPDAGATTIDFAAYCSNLGGNVPGVNEKVAVDVTFEITGAISISS